MDELKNMEEKLDELISKNRELVSHAQFWRLEHKRAEDEKFNIQKDYNELLFRKKKEYSELKKIHEFLENQIFDLSNKVADFGKIINECDTYQYVSREALSNSSFHRESSANSTNVHHVRPMIKGVTLKTAVLVVPRANVDFINGNFVHSPNHKNSSRNGNSQNTPKNKSNETSSPTQTHDSSSRSSHQIDSEDNGINLSTSLNISPKINKRGPFVSLSRIDSFDRKSCENIENNRMDLSPSNDKSKSNIGHIDNSKINILIQDSTSDNKENSFTNCEIIDNIISEDHLSITSRLECILEETEVDSNNSNLNHSSSMFSSKTPNKRRKLYSDSSKRNSIDDPLEGPSWRYKNNVKQENEIKVVKDYNRDNILENIRFSDNSIGVNNEDGNDTILSPQYQSTPISNNVSSQNFVKHVHEEKNDSSSSFLKRAVQSTGESNDKCSTQNKKNPVKQKSVNKNKNKKISTTVRKSSSTSRVSSRKSSKSNTSTCLEENSSNSSNSNIVTSRARRTKKVNYKEMSCIVKLRRE